MNSFLLLAIAAFAAGIVNALAGGGTFLTFPALIAAGIPPISANATSTVALYPAYFVSAWTGRKAFKLVQGQRDLHILRLSILSLIGGLIGGLLLVYTPAATFSAIIPWLLGFATLVFAIGNLMPKNVGTHLLGPRGIAITQSLISVYGGYFGGGVGLMMLATMTFYGLRDIKLMNVIKLAFVGLMNTAAVATFILAGQVHWPQALTMMAAGIAGGYAGGKLNGIIDPRAVKLFVVVMGTVLTLWFALKP